jgi:putative zinc finger/helix-turn-helix YgiT family protein
MSVKCIQCGESMTSGRENVPYKALPGVVLVGVEVRRCPECGEFEVVIPAIDRLNKVLAKEVIEKAGRLSGAEIRFLRSYLGYSAVEFARVIHSDPSTISRWEAGKQEIGPHPDLLLRAMVALDKQIDDYSVRIVRELAAVRASGARSPAAGRAGTGGGYRVTLAARRGWRTADAPAGGR